MTLELTEYILYPDAFAWVVNCIDLLPFHNFIEKLTINIVAGFDPDEDLPDDPEDGDPTEELFLQVSDCEVLSHCLQRLCEEGALKAVVLDIRMEVDFSEIDINIDRDSNVEKAKLEAGFEPLVQANVLDADYTLMQEFAGELMPRTMMHYCIRRV